MHRVKNQFQQDEVKYVTCPQTAVTQKLYLTGRVGADS